MVPVLGGGTPIVGWWQGVGVFCGVWGSCCVCCVLAGAGGVVLAASAVVVCVRMSWGVVWYGSLVWGLCWCGGLG